MKTRDPFRRRGVRPCVDRSRRRRLRPRPDPRRRLVDRLSVHHRRRRAVRQGRHSSRPRSSSRPAPAAASSCSARASARPLPTCPTRRAPSPRASSTTCASQRRHRDRRTEDRLRRHRASPSPRTAPRLTLTRTQLFLALAKDVPGPDGKLMANPYKMWSDIDPSLPAVKIEVLGPPPTSGTRDAFLELFMETGAAHHPGDRRAQEGRRQGLRSRLEVAPRGRRLYRRRRERQPDRPEARSQSRCGRHLRLLVPRGERLADPGCRDRGRRPDLSRRSPTAPTRAPARSSSTSRSSMSASFRACRSSSPSTPPTRRWARTATSPPRASSRCPADERAEAARRRQGARDHRRPDFVRPDNSRAAAGSGSPPVFAGPGKRAVAPAGGQGQRCFRSTCFSFWPSRCSPLSRAGRRGRALAASGAHIHSLPTYHGLFTASAAIIPMLALLVVWGPTAPRHRRAFLHRRAPGRSASPSMTWRAAPSSARSGWPRGGSRRARAPPSSRRAPPSPPGEPASSVGLLVLGGLFRRARRVVGLFPPRPAVPRPQSLRGRGQGGADRLLGGRDPHHRRHRLLGDVRDASLLRPLSRLRFPVRHAVEPADRDPRGSGRLVRRLRRGAALRRHDADHADRDADRRARSACSRRSFMAEYASPRVRGMAKPVLEILAGVPTVVFGFFAALTVAPHSPQTSACRSVSMSRPRARLPPGW